MAKGDTSVIETPHDRAGAGGIASGDTLLAVGDGQFLSHRLTGAPVTIGRDPACDFVIDHRSLSRRHATLRLADPPTIQDLGSTNGTRVGGHVIRGGEPIAIDDGGFRIGPFAFVVALRRAAASRSLAGGGGDPLRVDDPTPERVSSMVREFATSDANVLISGETGVGKEVLAATVHALSQRTGAFVQINCASLTESLLESELFGHERGAFTGAQVAKRGLIEAANGGTLLLDEIGELPLAMQAKLLRVIEQREVLRVGSTQPTRIDVRFIAATNRDLRAEVARGAFRADLFYRVDGVTLWIPPLRDRRGAIVPIAIGFLAGKPISADVATALEAYAWPGNVRELKAVLARASVLARGGEIAVRHLTFTHTHMQSSTSTPPPISYPTPPPMEPVPPEAEDPERARIIAALAECAGNQSRAAKLLGISRTTLITKIRIYRIPRPTQK